MGWRGAGRKTQTAKDNMKLRIEMQLDNAAFEPDNGTEIARILEKLATRWHAESLPSGESCRLLDINGNVVGKAEVVR